MPSGLNFESVDAVIVPNTSMQYFKYSKGKGNYGFKMKGLKKLDKALKSKTYNLWSCVPEESFKDTKFQNWVTTKGTRYKVAKPKEQELVQKMHQYVVALDFRNFKD